VKAAGPRSRSTALAVRVLSAVVFAGGALFGVMWLVVPRQGALGVDRDAFAVLSLNRGTWLARSAGSLSSVTSAVIALVALGVIVLLVARRRWLDAAIIIVGYLVVDLVDNAAKAAAQRTRPPGALVHATGFSFPSSHAASSVGIIAIAVALARLTPRRSHRVGLVAFGCVAAVVIGAALVAVRVHYLSDVFGGWGLGAAVFAACGLGALAIDRTLRRATRTATH
jgi:membrane-associated phospholipid phosphatase